MGLGGSGLSESGERSNQGQRYSIYRSPSRSFWILFLFLSFHSTDSSIAKQCSSRVSSRFTDGRTRDRAAVSRRGLRAPPLRAGPRIATRRRTNRREERQRTDGTGQNGRGRTDEPRRWIIRSSLASNFELPADIQGVPVG